MSKNAPGSVSAVLAALPVDASRLEGAPHAAKIPFDPGTGAGAKSVATAAAPGQSVEFIAGVEAS